MKRLTPARSLPHMVCPAATLAYQIKLIQGYGLFIIFTNCMKVIVYNSIDKKNFVDRNPQSKISSHEALIKTLDLMNFYSKFNSCRKPANDGVSWIVLKVKNYAKQ